MCSAVAAAAISLVSAWFLVRIGTYSGSKSLSRSTPSLLFGRSMMWPFEAITVNPRPRNFVRVRDFVGDSTMTSDFPTMDFADPFPSVPGFAPDERDVARRAGGFDSTRRRAATFPAGASPGASAAAPRRDTAGFGRAARAAAL